METHSGDINRNIFRNTNGNNFRDLMENSSWDTNGNIGILMKTSLGDSNENIFRGFQWKHLQGILMETSPQDSHKNSIRDTRNILRGYPDDTPLLQGHFNLKILLILIKSFFRRHISLKRTVWKHVKGDQYMRASIICNLSSEILGANGQYKCGWSRRPLCDE